MRTVFLVGLCGCLLVSLASGQVTIVSQVRSVLTHAGSDQDGETAPDHGPFDATATSDYIFDAGGELGPATAFASAHHSSTISGDRFFMTGICQVYTLGNEESGYPSAFASAEVRVEFHVSRGVVYSLLGSQHGDVGSVSLLLSGAEVVAESPTWWATLWGADGYLPPGDYMLIWSASNGPLGGPGTDGITFVGISDLNLSFSLAGDGNGDGFVTAADYTIWADNFGLWQGDGAPWVGDYNWDGFVTGSDYTVWSDNYTGLPESAPEPGTWALGLLAVGGLLLLRNKATLR